MKQISFCPLTEMTAAITALAAALVTGLTFTAVLGGSSVASAETVNSSSHEAPAFELPTDDELPASFDLECIPEGIRKTARPDISNRYLALLALAFVKNDPGIKGEDLKVKIMTSVANVGYCTPSDYALASFTAPQRADLGTWLSKPTALSSKHQSGFQAIFGLSVEKLSPIASASTRDAFSSAFTAADLALADQIDKGNLKQAGGHATLWRKCHRAIKEATQLTVKESSTLENAMRASCQLLEAGGSKPVLPLAPPPRASH
jgi:hypothetical protein